MFKGNDEADTIKYNVFEVPIIAQWVRINPTRWRDRISLRVELYGCEYGEWIGLILVEFLVMKTLNHFSVGQLVLQRHQFGAIRLASRTDCGHTRNNSIPFQDFDCQWHRIVFTRNARRLFGTAVEGQPNGVER